MKRSTRQRAAAYRRLMYKAIYAGKDRQAEIYERRAAQLYADAEREEAFSKRLAEQAQKRKEARR